MKEVHLPYYFGVNRYYIIYNISPINIDTEHTITQCQERSSGQTHLNIDII